MAKSVAIAICKSDNAPQTPCECTLKGDVCADMMDKASAALRAMSLYIVRDTEQIPDDCSKEELAAALRRVVGKSVSESLADRRADTAHAGMKS